MPRKPPDIPSLFGPVVTQVLDACALTDAFTDREMFQIYIATIWGNAVLDPGRAGLGEGDLPALHDFLNGEIEQVLGPGGCIASCFEFLDSDPGLDAMDRFHLTQTHKDFLKYFTRLVLASTR